MRRFGAGCFIMWRRFIKGTRIVSRGRVTGSGTSLDPRPLCRFATGLSLRRTFCGCVFVGCLLDVFGNVW